MSCKAQGGRETKGWRGGPYLLKREVDDHKTGFVEDVGEGGFTFVKHLFTKFISS